MVKIEILVENLIFCKKIKILVESRIFCKKMEILVENLIFRKIEILVKNLIFCKKLKFWSKIDFFSNIEILQFLSKIYLFWHFLDILSCWIQSRHIFGNLDTFWWILIIDFHNPSNNFRVVKCFQVLLPRDAGPVLEKYNIGRMKKRFQMMFQTTSTKLL